MATSETLRSVIDAGRTTKRLDELSTARVIGKIAEQLHLAQQKAGAGKAIGPITPAGISLETTGAAKLGLAEPTAVTYSSPEQITDDVGDRRSDVFSLGAVMWEALTHEPLFADAGEVKTKAIAPPSELNANIPAELGAICLKALARNPADRYQSAKVMAAEIEAVLEQAGYADTDERIAEHMAELGKPQNLPKITLITPPMGMTAPTSLTNPGQPAKLGDTLPSLGAPLPPILPAKLTEPPLPKLRPIDAKIEAKLAAQRADAKFDEDAVTTPVSKLDPVELAKPVEVAKPVAAAKPVEVAKPIEVAAPKVELPKVQSSPTVLGFASAAASETASPAKSDPVLLVTPKHASPEPKPAAIAPATARAPTPAPVSPDDLPRAAHAVPVATAREASKPNPAAVVALPARRDSTGVVEVLGGWGWGTGRHEAIVDGDEYDDGPPRKTLRYVIGGGLALAAIVTIVAIAFGGGSSSTPKRPAPQPTAVVREDTPVPVVVAVGTPSAAGSDVIAATGSSVGSDAVAVVTPDAAVVAVAADAAVAVAPPADAPAIVAVAKPPTPPAPTPTPPTPPPPKPHRVDPPHVTRADPPRVARVDPPRPRVDVEAAYKQGLQLYMRGDTQGALSSLRSALAANPSYAPTYRGLGLVFEKMNEKDQARAAYRKYLQLAPNAGDADHIRNRLERL